MILLLVTLFLLFSMSAFAASLQQADAELIEAAGGAPFLPDATFVQGSKGIGFHFAASTSPKTIQEWYRKRLPKWSPYNEYRAGFSTMEFRVRVWEKWYPITKSAFSTTPIFLNGIPLMKI